MPLLTGRYGGTRLHLESIPFDLDTRIEAMLTKDAFRPALSETTKVVPHGWVSASDLLRFGEGYAMDKSAWAYGNYRLLKLRKDEKRIPGPLFNAQWKQACRAWCSANNRERCPSLVKEEIKEEIEATLLQKITAVPTTIDLVLDVSTGMIFVGTAVESTLEVVRKRLFQGLGVNTAEQHPWHKNPKKRDPSGAARRLWRSGSPALGSGPGAIDREGTDVETDELPSFVLHEFLQWAWYVSDNEDGDLVDHGGNNVTAWTQFPLVVASTSTGSVTVKGESLGSAREAYLALHTGKRPLKLSLGLRVDDREYEVTVDGSTGRLSGARLPQVVRGTDAEESLLERMFLVEEVYDVVDAAWARFFELRISAEWVESTVPKIRAWAQGGAGEV